jgi:glutamyl-tRNA reductase
LDSYDWVVSATTTPTYIITPDMVDRNSALQFCIDLGVPRNIDPSLSSSGRRVLHLDELTDRLHLNRSRAIQALEVTSFLTERAWGKIHTKI